MPDMLTPQVLAMGKLLVALSPWLSESSPMLAGPLVLETLFKHFLNPTGTANRNGRARDDDLMYDEGKSSLGQEVQGLIM